jgi:hypothetical protein
MAAAGEAAVHGLGRSGAGAEQGRRSHGGEDETFHVDLSFELRCPSPARSKKSDGVISVFITRIETLYVFVRLNWA